MDFDGEGTEPRKPLRLKGPLDCPNLYEVHKFNNCI